MYVKPLLLFIMTFVCLNGLSQTYSVTGKLEDEKNKPVFPAAVTLTIADHSYVTQPDKTGGFSFKNLENGFYHLFVTAPGADTLNDSFRVNNANVSLGVIRLKNAVHMLNEVSIVEKVMSMVQKDDTLEYNSKAYKVNRDADAADLVKKMPSIQINDKQITAQGENVIKVMVDGKPFFGEDPYAALKSLPADVIDKVQVYNEKSDQERFTGFREGTTSKTINIITKPGKRNGLFGNLYAGGGADNSDNQKYGVGAAVNKFKGNRRITLTLQSNNTSAQDFTSDNSSLSAGAGAGTSNTHAIGVNYGDKWGKKIEVSGNYYFSNTDNTNNTELRKTYTSSTDSGQIFNQYSPTESKGSFHRLGMRLNYIADTNNSVIWTPNMSLNNNDGFTTRIGNTNQGAKPINSNADTSSSRTANYSFSSGLLLKHRFHKKGRTISANLSGGLRNNDGNTMHAAQNIYNTSPALNDTINQQTKQMQNSWNASGNATYTEPITKHGLLKLEYTYTYQQSNSDKGTSNYSLSTGSYSLPDPKYSDTFENKNLNHKAGLSYQVQQGNTEFSLGVNYQYLTLINERTASVSAPLSQDFTAFLPVATLNYKFTKTKNLQVNYTTNTQTPSLTQLQNVINNNDPLHLTEGNPGLKTPYRHNMSIRYNGTGKDAKTSFSVSINGSLTENPIASNTITANTDTVIGQNITLAKGSRFTTPVNTGNSSSASANITYGMPLEFIKCHLNVHINAGITNTPSIINSQINTLQNKNGGVTISVSSNISEQIDFLLTSSLGVVANNNPANRLTNATTTTSHSNASFNLRFWKGFVFRTSVSYDANTGLSAGYNQNYLLCNLSVGKKIFKNHQGEIRLTVFDALNENNSIQHSVMDTYIQDSRSNIVQRYWLLVFNYKLSEFKKPANK